MMKSQLLLGASMYVPTTRTIDNLVAIGNGEKYPALRSVIFCTEDAVRPDELEGAIHNLRKALPKLNDAEHPMRFIRVRNPEILSRCLRMRGIEKIDGFVLPKITEANLQYYLAHLSDRDNFLLMPTLETKEVFDGKEMGKLRQRMQSDERARNRILCLRIGGNDLLNCIRVRRDPRRTIYETPVGELIKRLAGEFIPNGFGLTAPVCEATDPQHLKVLAEEVELDLLQGLFGKTVIHPDQIPVVEAAYRVDPRDLEEAEEIVKPEAAAVFKRNGRMCEPTTHRFWANDIIERAKIYGVRQDGEPALRRVV
ncbi:MAG TPA: HpcH/HpaI aldolase/citrate lyase family protein [Candidatus Obscuribacterales bacterium]